MYPRPKRAHRVRKEEGEHFLFDHKVKWKYKYTVYYNDNNVKALADFETINNSLSRRIKGREEKLVNIKQTLREKIRELKVDSSRSTIDINMALNLLDKINSDGIYSLDDFRERFENLISQLHNLEEAYNGFTYDTVEICKASELVLELIYLGLNKTALESIREKILMEGFPEFISSPSRSAEKNKISNNNRPSNQEKKKVIEEVANKITGHGLSKYLQKTIEIYLTGFLKKPKIPRTKLLDGLLDKIYKNAKTKYKEKEADLLIENLERAKRSSVTSGWEGNLRERLSLEWPDYANKLKRTSEGNS